MQIIHEVQFELITLLKLLISLLTSMPIGHPDVHILQLVQVPVFLTLKVDKEVGNFKNAPQGQTNLQNPFLPKKYTIKNPSTIKVKLPITIPGRKAQTSG